MKKLSARILIRGVLGQCGSYEVFMGYAPAKQLHSVSFSDILNEDTGQGYQRPHNKFQSLDFKKYITSPNTSTIPLVFNLRKEYRSDWNLERLKNNTARLLFSNNKKCLARVDCQHRIGELHDVDIPLAFMTFIGLDLRTEMALFSIINSKAKGLSSSLTDYHESNLIDDLANEAPHLFIAKKLNEDPNSPWYKLVRYGGETTSGIKRRTSLRMMQKSVGRFLKRSDNDKLGSVHEKYQLILSFWRAVKGVFNNEWNNYRHHLITKGLGLYSLMMLLTDIVKRAKPDEMCEEYFVEILKRLNGKVDWRSKGMFSGVGGQKGANEVYQYLKKAVSK